MTVVSLLAATVYLSSCTIMGRGMREANTEVELKKEDFTFSAQVTGTATQTKIIGIDFERLFTKKQAEAIPGGTSETTSFAGVLMPIVGAYLPSSGKVYAYALYDLYDKNPGYDALFYPSFEREKFGFLFLYSKETVTVTGRLGKLN
jgi:hypothetical protein